MDFGGAPPPGKAGMGWEVILGLALVGVALLLMTPLGDFIFGG